MTGIVQHECKSKHIVFDMYIDSSLKSYTRSKRGNGGRRKVADTSHTPKSWDLFLNDSQNKTELFSFIADTVVTIPSSYDITVTRNEHLISNKNKNLDGLKCPQEEADTRMFVHARHAVFAR